jgi:diacylglycerol O-acyltransferase / wax synthase
VPDRLSPIEAVMWRAGHDPSLRMTVGIVVVLDHAPSLEALEERFAAVIKRSPRLQLRPGGESFGHATPSWLEDDAPDASHHLRSVAVSSPGTLRQMLDVVSLVEAVPFDPDHAPWDGTLIEGLEGGRAALYLRAHHVVSDGLAGLRITGRFFDSNEIDRDATSAPAPRSGVPTIDLTRALRPLQLAVNAARDPVTVVQGAIDLAGSVSRQLVITGGSLSPLLVDHSTTTRFEVVSVPGARGAALALGGSRNDLLVAGAASALGLYHERLGSPCEELRLSSPTTQRNSSEEGGNWFAPSRVTVPTDAEFPGPHFDAVAERLTRTRVEPALRFAPALASTLSLLPPQVLIPTLQAQAGTVDFVATAIPGLRGAGRICGARVESSYPFGPRLGCPLNLTAFGNRDRLDIGIALDTAAITEPAVLLECLAEAFAQLIPATG